jgi:tuftelin-interacting protein 11
MVSIVDERMKEQQVASDELLAIYEQVKEHFPEEYIIFDCPAIAVFQVLPAMKAALTSWNPLQAPLQWLSEFVAWKPLLETRSAPSAEDDAYEPLPAEPFSELLLEALYPPLRAAIMAAWDPTQPAPLLQFFDHWMRVLPPVVSKHMLRTMVLPRVRAAVHGFAEAPNAMPPAHLWLHPWLPYLATELQDLYPVVRKAITQLLAVRNHLCLGCRNVACETLTVLSKRTLPTCSQTRHEVNPLWCFEADSMCRAGHLLTLRHNHY